MVFFSSQSVVIDFLVYSGIIVSQSTPDPNKSENNGDLSLATRLQDFLICIEMCLAAIAHHYSFSYEQFVQPNQVNQSWFRSFLAMWDVSDVQRDIQEHLGIVSELL